MSHFLVLMLHKKSLPWLLLVGHWLLQVSQALTVPLGKFATEHQNPEG